MLSSVLSSLLFFALWSLLTCPCTLSLFNREEGSGFLTVHPTWSLKGLFNLGVKSQNGAMVYALKNI